MTAADFVHLHVHSDYSLLDGAVKVPALVKRAKAQGMTALAITDHGNLCGAIELTKACKKEGLQPIIGMEAYVAEGGHQEKRGGYWHLTLLAKDEEGFKNLVRLSSIGHRDGFYRRPRIDRALLSAHAKGLVCLSGCLAGEVSQLLLRGDLERAKKAAGEHRDIFGADYFLEIQPNKMPEQLAVNAGNARVARALGIPLVATGDSHYLSPDDHVAHDIKLCIAQGKKLADKDRLRFDANEFYLKPPEQMAAELADFPESLLATREIADRIGFQLKLASETGKYFLPVFECPEGKTQRDYFHELCGNGLRRRYGDPLPAHVLERYRFETGVIEKMQYVNYFLIVQDFINWAKRQGIPVGPGRGSAAGSIVAYALGITDLDPLPYDLLFERFLNPDRISMPDIDVDFCEARRSKVIDYVRGKYGASCVTQIITFGALKARAAVRDVGRVLDVPLPEVDRIAKMCPSGPKAHLGKALGFVPPEKDEVIEQAPELVAAYQTDPKVRTLIDVAVKVEGLYRNASTHAAGVVIADVALQERIPLFHQSEGEVTTQFPMQDVEEMGLLKMDFLGLRTLTVIDHAARLIRKRGVDLDLDQVPLNGDRPDVRATYALLGRGESKGVFQLESSGFRDVLLKMKPDRFEDIIALIALYRPGPIDDIPTYVARKHGQEKVDFPFPALEPILRDTYGVFVYQEQVMLASRAIAGFTPGEADTLRKVMGKKQLEKMPALRLKFVNGAVAHGAPEEAASALFDVMQKFGAYAFNKSHSAVYGLLTYRTAWLKANYPAEFMAAVLTSEAGDTDKLAEHVADCQRMGLTVLAPDVNRSEVSFDVRDGKVLFGLGAIKGIGERAAEVLAETRRRIGTGGFRSLFHFCEEVDHGAVNQKTIEALIDAGALDSLGARRAQLRAALDEAVAFGAREQEARRRNQLDLFGGMAEAAEAAKLESGMLPDVPEWPLAERLRKEREVLGLYLSSHPLDEHREKARRLASATTRSMRDLPDGTPVALVGMLTQVRSRPDKNGRMMAFIVLEDGEGTVEGVVFSSVLEGAREAIVQEAIVLVRGEVDRRREEASVRVNEAIPLEKAVASLETALVLRVSVERAEPPLVEGVRTALARYPGRSPVYVDFVRQSDGALARYRSRGLAVDAGSDEMRGELEAILGPGSVFVGAP